MKREVYEGITCESLLKLPECSFLEWVAGRKGLSRPITGVHYIEDFDYARCAKEGELIIVAGISQKPLGTVEAFIEKLHSLKVAGVVIYRGKDNVPPFLEEITKIGNRLGLCVYYLSHDVLLAEITQSICEAIFKNKSSQQALEAFFASLIRGDEKSEEEWVAQAYSLGYTHDEPYHCVVIGIEKHSGETGINQIKNKIKEIMNFVIRKNFILIVLDEKEIIILIQNDKKEKIENIVKIIIQSMYNIKIIEKIYAGISNACNYFSDFKDCYKNAKNMSKFASFLNKEFIVYDYSEIYSIFFEMNNTCLINNVYDSIVNKLIDYDERNKTRLLETCFSFVENNFNYSKTAENLFIHINTLRYRLNKIQDILDIKFRDPQSIYRMTLALHLKKYIEFLSQ